MDIVITDSKGFIDKEKINETHSLALRIFDDKGAQVAYRSTRLGTLKVDSLGVSFKCDESFIGCKYVIKDLNNPKEIITGKLIKEAVQGTKKGKKDE